MIVEEMRCYFMYNVPVTERLLTESADVSLDTPPALIDGLRAAFQVEPAPVPAFFTEHYRREHRPLQVRDSGGPSRTTIPLDRLLAIPYFSGLALTHDLSVEWEFELAPYGIGLITLCVAAAGRLPDGQAYRLAGLYLDPAFAVIDTAPIAHLWQHSPAQRPEFVTPDQLAAAVHEHFFHGIADVRRYRALRHEIQIPLISLVVSTDAPNQRAFVQQNRAALADFLFRPTCWEVGRSSQQHVEDLTQPARMWSVAEETLAILSYEGALLVRVREFETAGLREVSGFHLAGETAVLHTFKVAISNYHFMRIVDNLLDGEMAGIKMRVQEHRQVLRQLFEPTPLSAKREALLGMDQLLVQVMNLQFSLSNLLEETRNSDKLIDEESHIVLLDKTNTAVQAAGWHKAIDRKVEELRRLVATLERMRETLVGLGMNESLVETNRLMVQTNQENLEMQGALEKLQVLFVALAVLQFLQIVAEIWFNGFHNLTLELDLHLFGKPEARAGALLISLAMAVITVLSIWATIWLLNALKKRNHRPGPRSEPAADKAG